MNRSNKHNQDFDLGRAKPQIHTMTSSEIFEKKEFFNFYGAGTKNERSEAEGLVWPVTRILLKR